MPLYSRYYLTPFFCSLFILLTNTVSAEKVKVIDQHGNPVPNAVVGFPAPAEHSFDLQTIAVMDQVDQQFSPQVISIARGQFVKFPNSDDIRHHVYSFSAVKPFEIKLYKGTDVEPIQFDQPGIGVLGCNIHDNMIGYIYIADNEVTQVSNENGLVSFELAIPTSLLIWHPKQSISPMDKQSVVPEFINNLPTVRIDLLVEEDKPEKRTFGSRTFGSNG